MTSPPRLAVCLAVVLAALASAPAGSGELTGKVIAIADGDTLTVLDADQGSHRVRLKGVDAPEKAQAFGRRATESLSRLVFGQAVHVEWQKRDRYERLVGTVWVAPPESHCRGQAGCPRILDANLAQLQLGLAWWYREYAREQAPDEAERYRLAEDEARARQAGLWRDPSPLPPWDWRKAMRTGGH